MRRTTVIVALLALGMSTAGQSQEVQVRSARGAVSVFSSGSAGKLGLSVAAGSVRDTLGLLVTSITADGPAEEAGIIEGDRLVSVNDVPLTLSRADAGEPDMSAILRRRLERELGKVEAGDEVTLRVWSAGRTREVKVRAVEDTRRRATLDVYGSLMRGTSNRPVIGVSLSSTGSVRDTLGVFVTGVAAGGPAERAGIIEGHRIAAINDVDLRVPAADAGDAMVASTRSSRLAREIEKLEAGDRVQLRVWGDGRYRDVTVEVGRYEDVYKGSDAMFRIGGAGGAAAFAAPNVIIRSMPSLAPGRVEPLDSLWRRRSELRRSVDPRFFDDSSGSRGVYDFRFDDRIRQELERSLQSLRPMQLMPSRGGIITTSM